MKTVFIAAHEENIIKALQQEIQKHGELEVVGAGPLDEKCKQDCSFEQPDFIISGNIGNKDAKELLELCPSTNIIMVSNDMNRANSVINTVQKDGIYRLTAVDLENVSPSELCLLLLNHKDEEVEDTSLSNMFDNNFTFNEEELLNSEIATETIETQKSPEPKLEEKVEPKEFDEKDVNNYISVKETVRQNAFNLNINNIRSKTITVYSKKGGTGKTTLAKEMGNVFSSVKVPKKLQNGNEYLRTCIVDLDFERGNVRTFLGMENPSPNIYYWINDILDRLENKTDIEKIAYNQFQVMGYVKKIDTTGNYYSLVTSQGSLPARTMSRIAALDSRGDLFPKILNIIITSLKRAFDVVIIDTDTDYNEITKTAFEAADNILYVLNPTVADIENLKVFTDEIALNDMVDLNKVGIVINKMSKNITFRNELLDVLSLVKFKDVNYSTGEEIEKNYPLIADIPYDETIINLNNGYLFATNNAVQETKKGILKSCEFCLHIFKVAPTTAALAELQKAKEKKAKIEQAKKQKAEKAKNKLEKNKKAKKINQLKGTETPKKETEIEETKETKITTPAEQIEQNSQLGETTGNTMNPNEYLNSDLSKETLEKFVETLKSFYNIKKTLSGYPILGRKPKTINKKVWKTYQKQLEKEIKKSAKLKKTGK